MTLVSTSVAYLEVRTLERNIDDALVEGAQVASQSVVQELAAQEDALDLPDLRDTLHDVLTADPSLDALSVLRVDAAQQAQVVASTSTEERAEVIELARLAVKLRSQQVRRSDTVLMVVRPAARRAEYAVAATVGLESLLQARERGVRTAAELALPTIVIVSLVVYLLIRWAIGSPVQAIVHTMDAAARGDRTRTAISRRDELGTIARGLDDMLDRLDAFNRSLQDRVDEATTVLTQRNRELADNQAQLLTLRESLARAERVAALGQVAANVAHQAGTPLNLVSGYVQMIREDPRTDQRTRARLETVDTQIQQVIAVLRTFLDRARPAAGLTPVNLGDVINHVREVATPRLARASIAVRVDVAHDLPSVEADVVQLEMALLNLVSNALDAMPAGGTLTLAARAQNSSVVLEIADTGTGIAPDVVEHLFDPWVTTKPAGQGSGLGLAIVRDVVRAHGGSVTASNREAGAVFTITLPATTSTRT